VSKTVPPRKETDLPVDQNASRTVRPTTTEDRPPPATTTLMDVVDMDTEADEEVAKVEVIW
jgi:hypothetical protein